MTELALPRLTEARQPLLTSPPDDHTRRPTSSAGEPTTPPPEPPPERPRNRHWVGALGELMTRLWLRLLGYEILDYNWRLPSGELDIVARRFGTLTIVEVKTLTRANGHSPAAAVTAKKRARILHLAHCYLQHESPWHRHREYAISEVLLLPFPRLRIHRNAFYPEDIPLSDRIHIP